MTLKLNSVVASHRFGQAGIVKRPIATPVLRRYYLDGQTGCRAYRNRYLCVRNMGDRVYAHGTTSVASTAAQLLQVLRRCVIDITIRNRIFQPS